MKELLIKLVSVFNSLKGKKPAVIAIVCGIFLIGYYAVQKGYITEDMLDIKFITEQVELLFPKDSVINPVDTLKINVIDTLH